MRLLITGVLIDVVGTIVNIASIPVFLSHHQYRAAVGAFLTLLAAPSALTIYEFFFLDQPFRALHAAASFGQVRGAIELLEIWKGTLVEPEPALTRLLIAKGVFERFPAALLHLSTLMAGLVVGSRWLSSIATLSLLCFTFSLFLARLQTRTFPNLYPFFILSYGLIESSIRLLTFSLVAAVFGWNGLMGALSVAATVSLLYVWVVFDLHWDYPNPTCFNLLPTRLAIAALNIQALVVVPPLLYDQLAMDEFDEECQDYTIRNKPGGGNGGGSGGGSGRGGAEFVPVGSPPTGTLPHSESQRSKASSVAYVKGPSLSSPAELALGAIAWIMHLVMVVLSHRRQSQEPAYGLVSTGLRSAPPLLFIHALMFAVMLYLVRRSRIQRSEQGRQQLDLNFDFGDSDPDLGHESPEE